MGWTRQLCSFWLRLGLLHFIQIMWLEINMSLNDLDVYLHENILTIRDHIMMDYMFTFYVNT